MAIQFFNILEVSLVGQIKPFKHSFQTIFSQIHHQKDKII